MSAPRLTPIQLDALAVVFKGIDTWPHLGPSVAEAVRRIGIDPNTLIPSLLQAVCESAARQASLFADRLYKVEGSDGHRSQLTHAAMCVELDLEDMELGSLKVGDGFIVSEADGVSVSVVRVS